MPPPDPDTLPLSFPQSHPTTMQARVDTLAAPSTANDPSPPSGTLSPREAASPDMSLIQAALLNDDSPYTAAENAMLAKGEAAMRAFLANNNKQLVSAPSTPGQTSSTPSSG